ncbi:MAG: type IV secretion system DNA-binding domain-containing protein [Patescibacteria group bacterium]|nr:type IV secretion system DNA-binding domain-containing protein [Patescibacteria group bacterium]
MTNYRNAFRKFGIKIDDRRRHMYIVGKTGMGKTTLMENMILNDIYAGHGVGLVDPHGDYAEKIINYIPANRINDVVYFNPADINFPIGFNILETINPEHKHLVASGLMGVFKKIWPDVWSARMEYILNNTILALLDFPGTTLLGINRLLADDAYRDRVVRNLKDPVVKAFWETEFASYNDRYKQEAVAPIQNKIGQFLSASVIRNIVAQVKSRIDIREIMDSRKIFIMDLSKGRIGEDNSRLLGGMLITKIQLSTMERVDTPEKDRKDFFLYVDEFQNFATESFANILSEARKYRLDLTMAHQYMEQLDEKVLAAVIGNVGSTITFRVGSTDATILAKEYAPIFLEEDLVNIPKFNIYLKLMIDGVASRPFSAITLPPIGSPTGSAEKVIRVSRERYATPREGIEDKIKRWTGIDADGMDDEEGEAANISATTPVVKRDPAKTEAPRRLGDFVKKNNEPPRRNNEAPRRDNKFKKPAVASRPAPRPINEILAEENEEPPAAPVIKLNDLKPNEPMAVSVSVGPAEQPPVVVVPKQPESKFVRPGQVIKFDDKTP